MKAASEWGESETKSLRILWDEGVTASEIGQRLGRTPNSIVGKANRLRLTPRPSPIKRDGSAPKPPYSRRQIRVPYPVTLAPLAALLDDPILLTEPPRERAPKPVVERPAPVRLPVGECCFPISDGRPWQFCCAQTEPGKPYCATHAALCYAPRRAAEQEMAA